MFLLKLFVNKILLTCHKSECRGYITNHHKKSIAGLRSLDSMSSGRKTSSGSLAGPCVSLLLPFWGGRSCLPIRIFHFFKDRNFASSHFFPSVPCTVRSIRNMFVELTHQKHRHENNVKRKCFTSGKYTCSYLTLFMFLSSQRAVILHTMAICAGICLRLYISALHRI